MVTDIEAPLTRGHRKKERTRKQLLEAGLRVLRSKGTSFKPKDVIEEAGVSTGTFYNYFTDTDVLIDEIMRDELLKMTSATASEPIGDPALRIAVSATRILHRAANDPLLSHFVLRLVYRPAESNQMTKYLREDLIEGFKAGRFTHSADDSTLDMASGLLIMTIRRIASGNAAPDFITQMITRLLESLGVPRDEAQQLAEAAPSVIANQN